MPRRITSARATNLVKGGNNLPYSMLIALQEIDLHTNEVFSLLNYFRQAFMALYKLNITLTRRTTTEKAAELKRAVYGEILQPLEEYLQTEYARVNLLYKECSQEPVVSFTKPSKISLDLYHPDARRLLDLLVGLDQMYRKLIDLWFAQQIEDGAYVEMITNCRHSLKVAMKRIDSLVYQAVIENCPNPK